MRYSSTVYYAVYNVPMAAVSIPNKTRLMLTITTSPLSLLEVKKPSNVKRHVSTLSRQAQTLMTERGPMQVQGENPTKPPWQLEICDWAIDKEWQCFRVVASYQLTIRESIDHPEDDVFYTMASGCHCPWLACLPKSFNWKFLHARQTMIDDKGDMMSFVDRLRCVRAALQVISTIEC
jgi:hypothetical protein